MAVVRRCRAATEGTSCRVTQLTPGRRTASRPTLSYHYPHINALTHQPNNTLLICNNTFLPSRDASVTVRDQYLAATPNLPSVIMHPAEFSSLQSENAADCAVYQCCTFTSRAAFRSIGRVNARMTYNSSSQCMAHTRPRLMTFIELHFCGRQVVYRLRDGPWMN